MSFSANPHPGPPTDSLYIADPSAGSDVDLVTARPAYATDHIARMPTAFVANVAGNISYVDSRGTTKTGTVIAGVYYFAANAVTLVAAATTADQIWFYW